MMSRSRRLAGVAVVLGGAFFTACGPGSDVSIFPPRVPQGGRAVAITVSAGDAKRIVVATETGGLFRSFDGGLSFQHLDGFPTIYAVDVAMASLDPNTIIATAGNDFATIPGGGIWRSTDGGVTWKRPGGWPPDSSVCNAPRPTAAGISHMPLTRTFYVATDCGLSVSTDNGATFTTAPLDPANPMLFSVLVINRSTGVAADNKRIWFLNNGQWTPSLGGPDVGATFTPHAFASPFWAASNIFYHAGRDRKLWVSTTSGGAWRLMPTHCDQEGDSCGNREPFVRVGRGLDGDPTHFDVYYGDGFNIFREAVTVTNPGGNVGDWRAADHMDHRDPADIAFTPGFTEPLMLATDGGVHLTPDKGKNWKLTGSNVGGFVALQVVEMTGRQVGGSKPHLDLYYSTHDNDIKASHDGGATWPGSICCEGAYLQADRSNPAMDDGRVTGHKCDHCANYDAPPHMEPDAEGAFHDAKPDAPAAFQLVGTNYLQAAIGDSTSDYWLTGDRGSSWNLSFTVPGAHIAPILFSGNLTNPVTYVAVERGGTGAHLFRASAVSGTVTVRAADSIGMQKVAAMETKESRYAVFAVDPKNPDHLLAQDVFTGTKASRDGGITWFSLPALDSAASDSGRYLPSMNWLSTVTTIAWDPMNSCHILVGTMQNGVIRSADGGRTWAQVRGSKNATYVTSFFFPPSGAIWMSTFGRGLWHVNVDRAPPSSGRCDFPHPPGDVVRPEPPLAILRSGGTPRPFRGLADSVVCSTCTMFVVYDGWITDLEGDPDVRAVATSSGRVEQRSRDGRETTLTIANTLRDTESERFRGRLRAALTNERHVRGLVLDGTRLVAFIIGSAPLPIAPVRQPTVIARSTGRDAAQVRGFHFLPGNGAKGVTVSVERDTVVTGVPVSADGHFDTQIRMQRRPPGWIVVTVLQRDGLRTTVAETRLQIVAVESR